MMTTKRGTRTSHRRTAVVAATVAALSVVAASVALASSVSLATAGESVAMKPGQEVCDALSTGQMPGDGDNDFTVTAPSGQVVVKTCVKAGSESSGAGVEYATYDPGVDSVTIYGPSGKDISHWSALFAPKPTPTPTPTPDRKSTRLNSSHIQKSRMPSSA